MSAAATSSHSRAHSLLLLQKILNQRDGASPLTLVLDSLEQSARPLLREFYARAKVKRLLYPMIAERCTKKDLMADICLRGQLSKTKVILVSFSAVRKPRGVNTLVKAAGRDIEVFRRELLALYPAPGPAAQGRTKSTQRAIVVIDSLNDLAISCGNKLATFLTSVPAPTASVIGIYHLDTPLVLPQQNEYAPTPLATINHIATAILHVSSLQQEIERQKARNRALQEPEWGLKEEREGVLIGIRPSADNEGGRALVVNMELRRRSGRAMPEKYILWPASSTVSKPGRVTLFTDHVMFAPAASSGGGAAGGDGGTDVEQMPESTFNMGLTEKQRRDREGVVLPYFDAQTDVGAGEGGRILYEMGREDDFDDEEDEI